MKKQQCKQVTITYRGVRESDLESALDEAIRLLKEGYQSGHNSNDTGAFYFETSEDVPKRTGPHS